MPSPFEQVQATDAALEASVRGALPDTSVAPDITIGLVGCGWIAGMQLEAYAAAGFTVAALTDRHAERADEYRRTYAPDAVVYETVEELLAHPGLGIVDVATHTDGRPAIIVQCMNAGLSVLSQKPFVDDLATGKRLADAAEAVGVTLAVNQNGRWAPHFATMRALVGAGLIGDVVSADFQVDWPHDLIVAEMPAFREMDDLVLFDFGAHWFDIIGTVAPQGELVVFADSAQRPGQAIPAPMQADAIVTGEGFRAALRFRAAERFAESGSYRVSGTHGVITHTGASLGGDSVRIETDAGSATISIAEDWFSFGLAGAMREALSAIAADRAPSNCAASSLRGLEIAFAAVRSARDGVRVPAGAAGSRH